MRERSYLNMYYVKIQLLSFTIQFDFKIDKGILQNIFFKFINSSNLSRSTDKNIDWSICNTTKHNLVSSIFFSSDRYML